MVHVGVIFFWRLCAFTLLYVKKIDIKVTNFVTSGLFSP